MDDLVIEIMSQTSSTAYTSHSKMLNRNSSKDLDSNIGSNKENN